MYAQSRTHSDQANNAWPLSSALGSQIIMKKLFKNVVLASTILTIVIYILPYFDYANFTEKELDVLSYSGYGSLLSTNTFIDWALAPLWIGTNIGLYFFIKPFKIIFTVVLLLTSIASLFWGLATFPSIEFTIINVLSMLDGAILTMLYLTSISGEFESPP